MSSTDSNIKHYKDGQLHGPVVLVVADDGRLGLHCTVDQQSWLLPSATAESSSGAGAIGEALTTPDARRRTSERADFPDRSFRSPSLEHFAREHFA